MDTPRYRFFTVTGISNQDEKLDEIVRAGYSVVQVIQGYEGVMPQLLLEHRGD